MACGRLPLLLEIQATLVTVCTPKSGVGWDTSVGVHNIYFPKSEKCYMIVLSCWLIASTGLWICSNQLSKKRCLDSA